MLIIGLTGSFGTGKTFVASIFKSLGAKVVDADALAHKALRKNSSTYKKVLEAFGKRILDENRNIDRRKLAGVVFGKKRSLERLERIIHPEVIKEMKQRIKTFSRKDTVIIDAPLLVEAGLSGFVDRLIVVKSSRANQIKRCVKKFSIDKREVMKRIRSQIPLERKAGMADFVIDNDGTRAETRKQVMEIWKKISRNIV